MKVSSLARKETHSRTTDINTLIPAASSLIINDANNINSAGDITGQAFDPVTGEMPAMN